MLITLVGFYLVLCVTTWGYECDSKPIWRSVWYQTVSPLINTVSYLLRLYISTYQFLWNIHHKYMDLVVFYGNSILGGAVVCACKHHNSIDLMSQCILYSLVSTGNSLRNIQTKEFSNTLIFVLWFEFLVAYFLNNIINILILFGK